MRLLMWHAHLKVVASCLLQMLDGIVQLLAHAICCNPSAMLTALTKFIFPPFSQKQGAVEVSPLGSSTLKEEPLVDVASTDAADEGGGPPDPVVLPEPVHQGTL